MSKAIIKMFIEEMKKGKIIYLYSIYMQSDGIKEWHDIEWRYNEKRFICQYDDELNSMESYTEDEIQSIFKYEWADGIEIWENEK